MIDYLNERHINKNLRTKDNAFKTNFKKTDNTFMSAKQNELSKWNGTIFNLKSIAPQIQQRSKSKALLIWKFCTSKSMNAHNSMNVISAKKISRVLPQYN